MMRRYTLLLLISTFILFSLDAYAYQHNAKAGSLRSSASSISHLKLKGTLFTRDFKPLAIIKNDKSGRTNMYESGDVVDGCIKIVSISRGEVFFKTQQGEYILSLPKGGVSYDTHILSRGHDSRDEDRWYNITEENGVFLTDKQTVSEALHRVPDIVKGIRFKPYYSNGKKQGLIVTRFTQLGILKEVGIKEGDIILGINGSSLNSPRQILSAYRKLEKEEFKVDIIRDNKPLTLTYKVL